MKDKEIEVNYEYAANRVYQKLIILSGIVFGILCFAILLKRFKLEAFAESKEEWWDNLSNTLSIIKLSIEI